MTSAWFAIGIALAALFTVAVAVACWEQWRSGGRRAVLAATAAQLEAAGSATRTASAAAAAATVDVELELSHDAIAAAAAATTTPVGVLGDTMARIARRGSPPPSRTTLWLDTQPITQPIAGPRGTASAHPSPAAQRAVAVAD